MRIAYLIIAHNNPLHFLRLTDVLDSPASGIFVHVDRKSELKDFATSQNSVRFLSRRVRVYWGDYSQIEATLLLMRAALSDSARFDRFVLLSGVDYPLRSAQQINQFFLDHAEQEFIDLVPMPCEAIGKPISRLTTYRVRQHFLASLTFAKRVARRLGFLPRVREFRPALGNLAPFAGGQWWALSRSACEYVLQFVDDRPVLTRFFKNTVCPDEMFFHTVIGNSPFRARAVRGLTYADWSSGDSHPAVLGDEHVEFLLTHTSHGTDPMLGDGNILFARKFSDGSSALTDRIRSQWCRSQ